MSDKLSYVTKKQVDSFIKTERERLKMNNDELLKEVEYVLFDLRQYPNDNKNQIKFYTKVRDTLKYKDMDLRSKDAIESSKQHEIDMNNILIAEFMGMQESNGEYYKKLYNSGDWLPTNELKFNTSWDWLMPVANEIIKSRDEQNADWDLTELKYTLCTTNIELVYKAVVEFINYYNKEDK